MFSPKDLKVSPIPSQLAVSFIKKHHYSGKVVMNSQIHFGASHDGVLMGVLSFGASTDKRRMSGTLKCGFNEFLELNRMAMHQFCPKNSESRVIAICLRILKKQYPHLKCIVSFADGYQCGDGTIYRASGFRLIGLKKNVSLLLDPKTGDIVAHKSLDNNLDPKTGRTGASIARDAGFKPIDGNQFKYVYFFDKKLESQFSFIDFKSLDLSVKMYLGAKRAASIENDASGFQSEKGGVNPTAALQNKLLD